MAVTTTTRLGLTRWSDGGDPFTRSQMDASHAALETLAMIYLQGTFAARPTAGTAGRFYYSTDQTTYYYDDGVAWRQVGDPLTVTTTATQTLTNKTLTAPIISTISNTGTLTLPTSTDTLVGRATTDTLTNKTLTAPVISTISNGGTLTLPSGTDTLVGRATTDTLTNKTLTLPTIGGTGARFAGATSGTTTVVATATAGTTTLTLPAATDQLVGRATTDTLTNKTIDGNNNTFQNIPQSAISGLTSGYVTLTGTETLTNKTITSPRIDTILTNAGAATVTLPTSTDTLVGRATTDTLTNKTLTLPTIGGTGARFSGATSGTTTVVATATAGTTTLTLPAATDTLVGRATTDTLTNKTLTSPVISTIVNTGTLTLPTSTDTLVGRATTDTLTNKTLTSPVISTIVNTGTLTLPTSTDTLVGRATTDTLTNKTLTSPTINGATISGTFTSTATVNGGTLAPTTLQIGSISNTGTLTLPTSTDTLVGRATTDTLTNKTLTSPTINGATLTGTVTLPATTSIGNVSSTEIGYVDGVTSSIQTQLDGKAPLNLTLNQQVASYTLVLADAAKQVEIANGSANTLTIPTDASVNFPVGTTIVVVQTGAGQTTIGGAGVTINGTPGLKLRTQWSTATLTKRAANTWLVSGDLVA